MLMTADYFIVDSNITIIKWQAEIVKYKMPIFMFFVLFSCPTAYRYAALHLRLLLPATGYGGYHAIFWWSTGTDVQNSD
jgi:general stress protein CsbA